MTSLNFVFDELCVTAIVMVGIFMKNFLVDKQMCLDIY